MKTFQSMVICGLPNAKEDKFLGKALTHDQNFTFVEAENQFET